jgi:DNA-binding response OmpR family regulator
MDTKAIVIVEDEEAIAQMIQTVLNDVPGYGAVTVADGALALEVIGAVHCDLVILDIDLPGLSGFAVHDLLRAQPRTARLPVLFMSAADHEAEFARRGVSDYLRKPFDIDDLLAHVEQLFGAPVAQEQALWPAPAPLSNQPSAPDEPAIC